MPRPYPDDIVVATEEKPGPQEAIDLYLSVQWGKADDYNTGRMAQALAGSSMLVTARNGAGELIGLARVLSDGILHTTVPDIVVNPAYHKQGVGRRMMQLVLKHFGHTPIYIEALGPDAAEFFRKIGLRRQQRLSVFCRRAQG